MYSLSQTLVVLEEIAVAINAPLTSLDLSGTFLENGGDSLSLIRLQHIFKKNGIAITLDFIFSVKSVAQLLHHVVYQSSTGIHAKCSKITKKRHFNAEILHPKRRRLSKVTITSALSEPHTRDARSYPMTELQLLFLHSSLSSPGMNVIYYHETHRSENVPALKEAWKAVTTMEPMLQCTYELYERGANIVERNDCGFDWEEIVLPDEASYEDQILNHRVHSGYWGSSFRVITLRNPQGVYSKSRIIWRVHHALVDGYSHLLLANRVQNYLDGNHVTPGPPFAHFAARVRAMQKSLQVDGNKFWSQKIANHPNAVSLPLFPAVLDLAHTESSLAASCVEFQVDPKSLLQRCRQSGVTLPTLYYTAWALTLSKYVDSHEISFGAIFCGRALPIENITSIVGPTINNLPVYIKLDQSLSLIEQMREVFNQVVELSSFQWTAPSHGYSRNFSTTINIQVEPNTRHRASFEPIEVPYTTMLSDIPLHVEILSRGSIRLQFNHKSFSQCQVQKMGRTFMSALSLIENGNPSIRTCLQILSDEHREELGRLGNWTASSTRDGSIQEDLVSLFTRSANEYPSLTALQQGSMSITYHDLHRQSTIVSEQLNTLIEPGAVVCVHADYSTNWIVAIYAVLKSRAVYCPFDEVLPMQVREQNFITSGAQVFLVGKNPEKVKKPRSCKVCLSVEEMLCAAPHEAASKDLEPTTPQPDTGAYLCFTSGSTGKPKGVLCKHKGIVAFQKNFEVRLGARPGWKISQFMSPAFDGSIHEIFSTLSYGATLLLKESKDPFLHLKKADAAILTPSVARALDVNDFSNLQRVYFVGEAVPQDLSDTWSYRRTLYNMYGPTEGTCGATIKRLVTGQPVSLGNPTSSSRVYILDKSRNLVPQGVIGEIYLAGIQVAAGYVGRPDETAARFLQDSIHPQFGESMYRTGDRGYWNDAGEIAFLGRSDRQIKLRGFRIDMDDIEVRILRATTEATAVAIALDNDELVAQVQPECINLDRFTAQIRENIPSYAIPRRVFAVTSFAMTMAGKLDYQGIASECRVLKQDAALQQSTSVCEQNIVVALRDVLELPTDALVDRDAHFLNLGATSILLLFLSHRLTKLLQFKVSVQLIIQNSTVRSLAQALENFDLSNESFDYNCLGEQGVAPIESSWFDKYQIASTTSAFNVNFVCELKDYIDREKLALAWETVFGRHKILNCNYRKQSNLKICRVYEERQLRVNQVQSLDVENEINAPFDLQNSPLIRITISPLHLVIVISHIICDLTTLRVLLMEVSDIYLGRTLEPVKKTYAQTQWHVPSPQDHLQFWRQNLQDAGNTTIVAHRAIERKTWAGKSYITTFGKSVLYGMKALVTSQTMTMHQISLAATALALQNSSETLDVTIGAPYLNRDSEDEQNVVGLFLEPLPIRIQYCRGSGSLGCLKFLKQVQRCSEAALSRAVPFDTLLSALDITPQYPSHPLFDIMVTFHESNQAPKLHIPGVAPCRTWTNGSKFKIMSEFTATEDDELLLRLEYSTECFSGQEIEYISMKIGQALAEFITELESLDL